MVADDRFCVFVALGEVQPGEAIVRSVVISNDAERAISVSRMKACCGGDAEIVPMSVPAKGEAKLTLRTKAQIPGEMAKAHRCCQHVADIVIS